MRNSIRLMKQAGIEPGMRVWVTYEHSGRSFPGVIKGLLPGFLLDVVIERKDGSKLRQTVSKDWVTVRQ